MFKNIGNFNNINDYLPLFTAALITDLVVIYLSNINQIKSKVLKVWYTKYNISAVIADVLSIFIGIIITRFLYFKFFTEFKIEKFILLAVLVQLTHDMLFYLFFTNVPRGYNQMLDTFKDYANELSYKPLIADAQMMISTALLGSILAGQSINTNIIILTISMYLLPYLIYK
jgi:uncharacterized protein YacL